jgi:hypothetical protein
MRPVDHGGHALGTTLEGCIPELIYPKGPELSLVTSRGQVSRPRNQKTTGHDELA